MTSLSNKFYFYRIVIVIFIIFLTVAFTIESLSNADITTVVYDNSDSYDNEII